MDVDEFVKVNWEKVIKPSMKDGIAVIVPIKEENQEKILLIPTRENISDELDKINIPVPFCRSMTVEKASEIFDNEKEREKFVNKYRGKEVVYVESIIEERDAEKYEKYLNNTKKITDIKFGTPLYG